MKGTNILAGLFRWVKTVIEEADKPLSLLITILLPFIAPVIPSIITAKNLIKYMGYDETTAFVAAVAFALVGYVSMVMAIGSIMNFVDQEHNKRIWLPVLVSTGSYAVYVLALVLVNVILEFNNGVEGTKIAVTALMTLGLELPSAGLNGMRVSTRSITEMQEKRRGEDREFELKRLEGERDFKLKKLSMKSQVRPQPSQPSSQRTSQPSSEVKKRMDEAYSRGKRVLTHSELVSMGFDKSTAWRHRNAWLEEHKIKEK